MNDTGETKRHKQKRRLADGVGAAKALLKRQWQYCAGGVWSDTRDTLGVRVVKTLNLSVKSFMDANLQSQACAMTYRTLLAIVPALAMLFAVGRGFGIQTFLQNQLYELLPGQTEVVNHAMEVIDSYLGYTGNGVFVGVGVVLLLWTLISLLSNVEGAFNRIWGIRQGRSFWRKMMDYTATLLILPILLICSGGLALFVSNTLQHLFDYEIATPMISILLKCASWLLTWLFFAAAYILIPNTKVRISNALLAGVIAGTGFRLLQWLFVTGQVYVTHYNAIYGSFAFLPLLLIWLQLTWVITLSGALICYTSQNIYHFSYNEDIKHISWNYYQKIAVAVSAVVAYRFDKGITPPTDNDLSRVYNIPPRLVTTIVDELTHAGVINCVILDSKNMLVGYQPARPTSELTVGHVVDVLHRYGRNDFVEDFDNTFGKVGTMLDRISKTAATADKSPVSSLVEDFDYSNQPSNIIES